MTPADIRYMIMRTVWVSAGLVLVVKAVIFWQSPLTGLRSTLGAFLLWFGIYFMRKVKRGDAPEA